MYTIYNSFLNTDTHNFNGSEWIIDGERGRDSYPGTYPKEYCERLYQKGISWSKIQKEYHKGNIEESYRLRQEGNK